MLEKVFTTPNVVSGTVVTSAIVGTDKILTADMLHNFVIFGATVEFWLALLASASVIMMFVYNLRKFFKGISNDKE